MVHKGHWFEEMINNRNKSVVKDMKWTSSGEKICIVYEDGAVIVGSVEGNRLWGKEYEFNMARIEWSPDGKTILFGTPDGEVRAHDYVGNYLFQVKIFAVPEGESSPLADIQWYENTRVGYQHEDCHKDDARLAIAYQCGKIQLMRSEVDDQPLLLDTGMAITQCRWNCSLNGNVLAVAGSLLDGGEQKGAVQFYNPLGHHLRTLRVPSQSGVVSSVSWEGFGLRMCLAVDSSILFANIQPEYKWAYFNNTLVYAFHKPPNPEMVIMFWDVAINEKHVRNMRNLIHIKAAGEYCVLVAQTEAAADGSPRYLLVLSNSVGCPIESKLISIEPRHVAMNKTHVIACSEDAVYFWQYRSQYAQGTAMESQKKKKAGKENAFRIDEIPSHNSLYDVNRWHNSSEPIQDPIVSVAAGNDGFIVGRDSGEVYKYTLPYI